MYTFDCLTCHAISWIASASNRVTYAVKFDVKELSSTGNLWSGSEFIGELYEAVNRTVALDLNDTKINADATRTQMESKIEEGK